METETDKIKVVYVLPYLWGGLQHYTAELANAVSKYANVTVITPINFQNNYFCKDVRIIEVLKPLNFSVQKPIASLSFRNIINSISFKSLKMLNELEPDIIHLTTVMIFPLSFFIFLYRLDKKFPIVFTKHGIFSNVGFGIMKIFETVSNLSEGLVKFEKIIVHGQHDKNILIKNGLPSKKIEVIPHGAYSFFEKYGEKIPTEKNCILFFGYIKKYKGLEYLIKAVPIIAKQVPDLKVIIAGEGDFSQYNKLIVDKSRFEIHNKFIPTEKVSELFQRAEIVVLPYSQMSGQSGILHIAYIFKKPVVVTNIGDIVEVVENGKTGYLVPPKDVKALATAIIKLLNDDDLKKVMGEDAYKKAREELSWDIIAKKTIALYKEIIKEKNSKLRLKKEL